MTRDRLERVYQALVSLCRLTGEPHLTDIARHAELPPSTTRRLLMKLIGEGRVVQTDWGAYRPGARDAGPDVGASFQSIVDTAELLSDATRAALSKLQLETQQGVLVYVPLLGQRLCVYRQLGDHAEALRSVDTQALWQAPLEVDPAGWVLQRGLTGERPTLARRPGRTGMPEAVGRAAVDGWDMAAVAFATSTGFAGSLCLLFPHNGPVPPQRLQQARLAASSISHAFASEAGHLSTRKAS